MACSFFNIGNDVAMQAVAIGFIIENKPKGCYLLEKTSLRTCFILKNHKFLRFVR